MRNAGAPGSGEAVAGGMRHRPRPPGSLLLQLLLLLEHRLALLLLLELQVEREARKGVSKRMASSCRTGVVRTLVRSFALSASLASFFFLRRSSSARSALLLPVVSFSRASSCSRLSFSTIAQASTRVRRNLRPTSGEISASGDDKAAADLAPGPEGGGRRASTVLRSMRR